MESKSSKTETIASAETLVFGQTKDGKTVHDRENSHFHTEGGMTAELLNAALSIIDTKDRSFIAEQVDFDRQVGEQTCVPVSENDEVVMVVRKNRSGPTPMVKNREPIPCNSVIVVLSRDYEIENSYTLVTSFVGKRSPREPWDPSIETAAEQEECQKFWDTHALLYDENLVDKERTEAYINMTDEERRIESIRERTFYSGLFVDHDGLYGTFAPTLGNSVENPHVTTNFAPTAEQLHLESLGSNAKIVAIGYGNNGKNEGLLVRIESDDPEIQKTCDALECPHITLSYSDDSHPMYTNKLEFTPLENPVDITGEYGLYIQGKPVFNVESIEK